MGRRLLQAAATPHLDRIAQSSEVGLLSLPSESGPVGSDVTSVAVLGYDPKKYYPGPGPLEAAGLGITVGEQDVVFRCTMVTVRGEGASGSKDIVTEIKKLGPHVVMEDATAGLIDTDQARDLLEAVNEQLGVGVHPVLSRRRTSAFDGVGRGEVARDMHRSSATGRPVDCGRVAGWRWRRCLAKTYGRGLFHSA